VVGAERPTTDFLGTGAGPLTFAAAALIVGRAQQAERADEIAGVGIEGDEASALCHAFI